MSKRIEQVREGRVLHLRLDLPPVNVLDTALLLELRELLQAASRDDRLAAVLLSGEGRCFSAGASVEEHEIERAPAMLAALEEACLALEELVAPVVAMVHGNCLGGAMELVSFCDFVVADPDARFGQPEIQLGFFPPLACYQLPRLLGRQAAAYALFTGETLDADRAAAMGMVQEILPRAEWGTVAARFNAMSRPVLRLAKKALAVGTGEVRRERLAELRRLFLEDLYKLDDVREGIRSFGEKRKPKWSHS